MCPRLLIIARASILYGISPFTSIIFKYLLKGFNLKFSAQKLDHFYHTHSRGWTIFVICYLPACLPCCPLLARWWLWLRWSLRPAPGGAAGGSISISTTATCTQAEDRTKLRLFSSSVFFLHKNTGLEFPSWLGWLTNYCHQGLSLSLSRSSPWQIFTKWLSSLLTSATAW